MTYARPAEVEIFEGTYYRCLTKLYNRKYCDGRRGNIEAHTHTRTHAHTHTRTHAHEQSSGITCGLRYFLLYDLYIYIYDVNKQYIHILAYSMECLVKQIFEDIFLFVFYVSSNDLCSSGHK